ncbi:MAG: DUF2177 family protein [Flammeovirgaceae bacterium]
MSFILTTKFLKILLISAALFVLLDFLWLGVVAAHWYRKSLGYLADLDQQGKINFSISHGLIAQLAISFTLSAVISLGLQIENKLIMSICLGASIGFAFYVCYDFTNLSFVKGWPMWISIIDIMWGTLQGAIAGVSVYFLTKWI